MFYSASEGLSAGSSAGTGASGPDAARSTNERWAITISSPVFMLIPSMTSVGALEIGDSGFARAEASGHDLISYHKIDRQHISIR